MSEFFIFVSTIALVGFGLLASIWAFDTVGYHLYLFRKRVLGRLVCWIRGHHNWEWRQYGGLGGSYCVRKCSCCDESDDDSFTPDKD